MNTLELLAQIEGELYNHADGNTEGGNCWDLYFRYEALHKAELERRKSNTHYGLIITSVPPGAYFIASGPQDFCRTSLEDWIKNHPLGEYDRAEVVERAEMLP